MLKVGFVINYIVKNGPSSVVLNIINNLDRTRFEPAVITLFEGNDKDVVQSLRQNGVEVFECRNLSRMKCIFGMDEEFQKIAKKFHVLHTHGFIPDVLSSRVKGPVKKVSTIHNNMFEDYINTYGLKGNLFIKLHLLALKKIDKNICCAKSVYDVMKPYVDNLSYIRNGINKKEVKETVDRKKLGIPENARVFLYVGVLSEGKNITWLIDHFVKYHTNDEYFLVLGKGEKEEDCQKLADDHVKILGFRKNPMSYMNISDVYISASKSEGFSISVLEALSNGLSLLLSDIPSHKEVISMSNALYLGELFNEETFGNALSKLREKKPEKEQIMKFQSEFLSAKHMTEKYQEEWVSMI